MGFFLQDELRVAGDAGRKLGRQRDGFVKAVGVQALRAAKHRRHAFDGGAHNVVVRVLLGQAPAAGLAMGAQHQAFGVLGVEAFHDAAPQQPRRPHFGDFQIEIHAHRPEKAQARREVVHIQPLGQRGAHVLLAVSQREGQLQRLVGASFLHVVARNRDRIELGHVVRRVFNDVANDAHAGRGRVDVGVAHHELFEHIVLNGAAELRLAYALLFSRHHITGQHGQHRAVHGHGHTDNIQRDLVEQDFHVLHRVNRHAGLAHITGDAGVVRVVAPVRGQVKRD